jgi:hydrogenase maturation protease
MSPEESGEIGGDREKRILILGVGNLLLSDEGVGVHIARTLMEVDFPPEVRVVEGGTDGFGLMHVLLEADRLILVDAVKAGGLPGSIYRFEVEDCPPFPDIFKTSVHQVSILEVLNLSGLIGSTPRTTIIGVEPKSLEMGMDLSPEIEAKIPKVIQLIKEEVAASLDGFPRESAVEAPPTQGSQSDLI